jgi:6-phosphogluconolactonase (cycloisomerase 2 family)
MEIKQRMSKRFGWLLGVVVLVSIGLLVACGTSYHSASDGLVVVGSQGSALLQTFSFDLDNGGISSVYNSTGGTGSKTCVLPGEPSSIILDPAGAYAYAILNSATSSLCQNTVTGIQAFKVNSDGTLATVGSPVIDPSPVALAMDSAGKFLFVAEGLGLPASTTGGGVNVYTVSSGSLTAVGGYTVSFPPGAGFLPPDLVALAVTPTVFPAIGLNGQQNSACSDAGNNPPTSEYLYVVDASNNDVVWEFSIDSSTGALGNPTTASVQPFFSVDAVASGVAVDPCDRFVYVSNKQSNSVSAFTICNGLSTQAPSPNCPTGLDTPYDALVPVSGSPFSITGSTSFPGPILVDPYGNTVYVLGTASNTVSIFRISPVSGSLTAGNPATVATGLMPTSMAIRSDDSWLFVTNFNAGTLSEYSITPASGGLIPQPPVYTDNYPWGVAVK